ncbi:hypothetical protein AALB51_23870 [Lachnospiraceae bacterium 62-26]|nr:hypothetical protein [Dorea sp.]
MYGQESGSSERSYRSMFASITDSPFWREKINMESRFLRAYKGPAFASMRACWVSAKGSDSDRHIATILSLPGVLVPLRI